ncbi:MAG: hypothetical protein COA33_002645 [Fluviicola sp.]|nr:hypothetical protein [Fluviicola sp.]
MNEFEKNISKYWTGKLPKSWSFLDSIEDANNIPTEHKDQIHFLNEEGSELIRNLLIHSKMTGNIPLQPFKNYFKVVKRFSVTENCSNTIKKWLYNTGIPFSKYVLIDSDRSGSAVILTWKMVIKYWEGIFFSEDVMIFDSTFEWGLFYFHHDELYFGNQIIFDRKVEEEKMIQLNEFIKKTSKN